MLSFLFSLLSAIPSVVNGVTDVLKKRADADVAKNGQNVTADTQINLAVLNARLEELKIAAAQRAGDRESPWTAWMMPALFSVCFIHFTGIVFDSMPMLGHEIGSWKIPSLPGDYATVEMGVLGSIAGLKLVSHVGGAVKKIFTK